MVLDSLQFWSSGAPNLVDMGHQADTDSFLVQNFMKIAAHPVLYSDQRSKCPTEGSPHLSLGM